MSCEAFADAKYLLKISKNPELVKKFDAVAPLDFNFSKKGGKRISPDVVFDRYEELLTTYGTAFKGELEDGMVSVEFDADGKPEVSTSKARFAGYHMDDILLWNEVGEGIRSVHFFRSEEVGRTEYRKVDQNAVRTARRNVKKPLNNDPEIVVEPERHMDLFLGYSYRDATSLSLAYRFDPGKVAFDYHIINRSTVRGSGEFKEGDYQLAALMDFADGLEEVYKMPGTGAEGRREYYQSMMTILGIPVYPGWDRMFSFDEPLHP